LLIPKWESQNCDVIIGSPAGTVPPEKPALAAPATASHSRIPLPVQGWNLDHLDALVNAAGIRDGREEVKGNVGKQVGFGQDQQLGLGQDQKNKSHPQMALIHLSQPTEAGSCPSAAEEE
jgi:hypothetical protein